MPRAQRESGHKVKVIRTDNGGEFIGADFEKELKRKGIQHQFTVPYNPLQNGVAEQREKIVIELSFYGSIPPSALKFITHAPRVSHPKTSPTLHVGDVSAFRVWGSLSLVHDLLAGKLSPRTLRWVFLGFPTNAPPWQFYHPGSRRVLSSREITFDDSVCFSCLHPHRSSLVLQRFGFRFSSPQPTPLPIDHSLSAPLWDESIEPSGPYPELVGSLIISAMGLVLGGGGPVVLTGHSDASRADDQATQRSSQGYSFSLVFDSISWRSNRSSSVLSLSCEELRWLTYLLTDLGERPHSPPVLYAIAPSCLARAPHCWQPRRLALPARRPAGRRIAPPRPRVALLAAAPPCPARALPCWPPRRLAGHRTALPCTRAALLVAALPCYARAPPSRSRRPCLRAALLVARHPVLLTMASLSVLTFDHEGRPIQFDTWPDDLQQYLLSDSRDNVSLFDHTFGASLAPPDTADSATRSQWLTRDAAARLAVCNHLPLLFPELSAFATIEDLITHLCTRNARYRAALTAKFLHKNPPPMYITLYFIVPRLPDSLRAVKDHFLALDPTDLTIDLLEKHLLAAETSVVDDVGATSALSGKRRRGKGKGGKSRGGGSGGGCGEGGGGGRGSGGGGESGGGSRGFGCDGGGSGGSGGGSGS
ncbi:unnamed protein product [Closterium sp. NIES-53]